MPRAFLPLALTAMSALLSAQSPCYTATGARVPYTIESGFTFTHYVGAPTVLPGYGAAVMMDLTTSVQININRAALHILDALSANLYGQTTQLELYTCPITSVGNETTQGAWTLLGTAPLLMNAAGTPSSATFPTPVPSIAPGSWGICLRAVPYNNNYVPILVQCATPSCGGNQLPTDRTDQFVSLTQAGFTRDLFAAGVGRATYLPNYRIEYDVAQTAARSNTFGTGCYAMPATFYERFPVNPSNFDLSNQTLSMMWLGSTWAVSYAPTSTYFPPSTGATGSIQVDAAPPALTNTPGPTSDWNDALSAPITLPFSLPAPGGLTISSVVVGSNGFLYLDPAAVTTASQAAAFYSGIANFIAGVPRLAAFFGNLDPQAGGSIYYDIDPSGTAVYFTFDQVMEYATPSVLNTFQIMLDQTGNVEFRYHACRFVAADVLVGYTPGNGTLDPGGRDLTATTPFLSGDGAVPLALELDARPVLGTAPNLVTTHVHGDNNNPFNPVAGLVFMGLRGQLPGTPLTVLGMDGCQLFLGSPSPVLLGIYLTLPGQPATVPLNLPNIPAIVGVRAFAQSTALTPGFNPAGIWTSNGVCMILGNQ